MSMIDVHQTAVTAYRVEQGPHLDVLGIGVGSSDDRQFPTVIVDASGCPALHRMPVCHTLPDDPNDWPIRSRVTPAIRMHGLKIQVEIAVPEPCAFWFYLCPCLGPGFRSLMTWVSMTGSIVVTGLTLAERMALELAPDTPMVPHGGLVLPIDLGDMLAVAEKLARWNRLN